MSTNENEVSAPAPSAAEATVKVVSKKGDSVLDKGLALLSSVRFGLVMLSLLLTCCMIGMLIMQINVDGFEKYYLQLTPAKRDVYQALGFFDIYHSWYFSLLLAITGLNIILASIDRFPAAWQYVVKPKLAASPKFIAAQMFTDEHIAQEKPQALTEKISLLWRKEMRSHYNKFIALIVGGPFVVLAIMMKLEGGSGSKVGIVLAVGAVILVLCEFLLVPYLSKRSVRVNEDGDRITVFAQRNVWNRLGAYFVHVALLTIFIGGFMTNKYGLGGQMQISPEDEASNEFVVTEFGPEGKPRHSKAFLPFKVECRDIQQKLVRPEGSLDQSNTIDWLSYITVVNNNERKDLDVHLNNVGSYNGYRFFQSMFDGSPNARQVTVVLKPDDGGSAKEFTLKRNEVSSVDGLGQVLMRGFTADFTDPRSREYTDFATAEIAILSPDGKVSKVAAFSPKLTEEVRKMSEQSKDQQIKDNLIDINGKTYSAVLKDYEKVSTAHTLTIQYDPGRTPVYIGFLLLSAALCGVFFFAHQRVWAVIEPSQKGSKVFFGGNTNRNRPAFEERFKKLVYFVIGRGGTKDE